MGGMFSVVKVREGLSAGDYSDPGWYENPPGTQAYEWTGELPEITGNRPTSPADQPAATPAAQNHKHNHGG
jgi:hypothetical protein